MKNFQTLYQFEMRKILSRKIVRITVIIMLILTGFTVYSQFIGSYLVNGTKIPMYLVFQKTKAQEQELTGRIIDQQLLEETWTTYRITSPYAHYLGIAEHYLDAFPYNAIYNFVRAATDMNSDVAMHWEPDEEELYRMRQDMLENHWNSFYLYEGEKAYWRQQELSVEKPFKYAYKQGWWTLLDALYTIGLMAQLTIAVCLSNVFTVEQVRKTDQLILCSRYGKGTLYLAKIFAGISFSAGISLLYMIAAFVLTIAVYGGDGFSAAIQLIYTDYSAPLSVGGVVLIGYGLMFVASILTGIFTMVLSQILRNGIGTLAVIGGIIILSMFVLIPYQYRMLAQIWDYLPCTYISIWNILDCRLVPFFRTYLTSIQFVPILYIVIAGILSVTGFKIYQKYQVGAR